MTDLHVRRAGSGPTVVLLHGLFGAGGNLGALARSLQDRYTVLSVDLPGHGRSGWLAQYSLDSLTAAVAQWLDADGVEHPRLIGHSLGGKVAMQLALRYPDLPTALVVADIAPVEYPGNHTAVFEALDEVTAANPASRDEAAQLMAGHLEEEGVIQFLLASLQRDPEAGPGGGYRWRLDVEGLRRDYDALRAAPAGDPWPGPILFVKGGDSNYISAERERAIRPLFPAAELQVMDGCGHWLHVEKPQQFNDIVGGFLAGPAAAGATGAGS